MSFKMSELKPFFRIAGGKWRSAKRYPQPIGDTIVEPFAGSAGYSLRYANKNVLLSDANSHIVEVWDYLINVKASEIRALPIPKQGDLLADFDMSTTARKWLGLVINIGNGQPRHQVTRWKLWNENYRERVAQQVDKIRHWKVQCCEYQNSPHILDATYFIDPPYTNKQMYKDRVVDFDDLGRFCQTRPGPTIVCEGPGASWLPFREFGVVKTHSNANDSTVKEFVWTSKEFS